MKSFSKHKFSGQFDTFWKLDTLWLDGSFKEYLEDLINQDIEVIQKYLKSKPQQLIIKRTCLALEKTKLGMMQLLVMQ